MRSLERNMSRNLARLKYSTPAVLVALACMAAPSFAMAEAHGSGIKAAASAMAQAAKTGPAAQTVSSAPSTQSLSVSAQSAFGQAAAPSAPSVESLSASAAQSAFGQAAAPSAPSVQSLSVSAAQSAFGQAAAPSAPSVQSLSVSAAQSASAQAAAPSAPSAQSLSVSGAQLSQAMTSTPGAGFSGAQASVAVSPQTAPTRMAALSNAEAADAQSAMINPHYVAGAYSVTKSKTATQGVYAARKPTKVANAGYSSAKAAAFDAAKPAARIHKHGLNTPKAASK
jgi:hypothetical protein